MEKAETLVWPEQESALKSPWVKAWIVLLMVMILANASLVYFAVSTSPGLVVDNYYERGQSFQERTKKEFVRKNLLGWKLDLRAPDDIMADTPAVFSMHVTDSGGAFVDGKDVRLLAFRPSDSSKDFSVELDEKGNGTYSADVRFPLTGWWDIIIEAGKGDDRFDMARRVFVKRNL